MSRAKPGQAPAAAVPSRGMSRRGGMPTSSNSVRRQQHHQQQLLKPSALAVQEEFIDLTGLSQEERDMIQAVLDRDAELRHREQERVVQIKKEIRELRMRGVIRNDRESEDDASDSCARCRKKFGLLFNRPRVCILCSHRICPKCSQQVRRQNQTFYICSQCMKQIELESMTGQWFELLQAAKSKKVGRKMTSSAASDVVYASLKRARTAQEDAESQSLRAGSTVGSTIGDVKRAMLSRTSGTGVAIPGFGGASPASSSGNEVITNSMRDYSKDRKLSPQQQPMLPSAGFAGQSPENASGSVVGSSNAANSVEIQRVRIGRHGRQQSSDDEEDERHQNQAQREPEQKPEIDRWRAERTSTRDRQITKPPSPGGAAGAARVSPGPIWDYRDPTASAAGPTGAGSGSSLRNPAVADVQRRYPNGQRLDDTMPFVRGDPFRNSIISTASSVGTINVVTSDEEDDTAAGNGHSRLAEVDEMTTDLDSGGASPRSLQVGDTPTAVMTPEYPTSAMPAQLQHHQTAFFPPSASPSVSPRTPRNLAAAVRDRADALIAAESASGSDKSTAAFSSSMSTSTRSTVSGSQRPDAVVVADRTAQAPKIHIAADRQASDERASVSTSSLKSPVDVGRGNDVLTGNRKTAVASAAVVTAQQQQLVSKAVDEVDGRSRTANGRLAGAQPKSSRASSAGGHGSDGEENEDIGDMFDRYGGIRKKSASQSNLERLSPFSSTKESIVSMYSNAGSETFGKFPVSGEIEFGLSYNYKLSTLEVHIKQCRNIHAVDAKRNSSDAYVKTYLLPDKTKNGKRKTRVKKHTTAPVFDEVVKYHVTKSELESRTLCVMVWNNDRFGRNDFLGEVNIGFDHHSFDDQMPKWYRLQDRPKFPTENEVQNLSSMSTLTYKGDLNVCLRFVSAETLAARRQAVGSAHDGIAPGNGGGNTGSDGNGVGELHVVVKQARNLTPVRANGHSDPFCKCNLLPDRSRHGTQKSPVIKRNCNPNWNHTFVFENVSWNELRERSLELTIWDHDRLVSNDFLGGARLNLGTGRSSGEPVDWMDSKGEEISLWQAMLDRPNCWIEGTLLLRVHMGQRQ